MTDLDELERLARAATPGPWESVGRFIETKEWVEGQDGDIVSPEVDCMAYCYGGSARGIGNPSDAEFIAAANPKVVLALIERVRRVEAERDAALAAIERCRGVLAQWEARQARNREILGNGALGHFQAIDCTGDLREALDGAPEPEEKP